MKVWLLVLYMAGGTLADTLLVDDISSRNQCEALGAAMAAETKQVNSGNRYIFRCFEVEKALSKE